ncbi:MAG TPA: hypothetical protein VGM84_24025 [Steroidobacteraceae bacterium]|jgi:hypothetical protein
MDPTAPFHSLAAALGVLGFWLFLGASAVTAIITDYRKKRLATETLRVAIERGQSIDPAIVAAMIDSQKSVDSSTDPRNLTVGGIICTSAGVGVAILSFFIARVSERAFYPIMGGGVVTICVGIGVLLAGRYLHNTQKP